MFQVGEDEEPQLKYDGFWIPILRILLSCCSLNCHIFFETAYENGHRKSETLGRTNLRSRRVCMDD